MIRRLKRVLALVVLLSVAAATMTAYSKPSRSTLSKQYTMEDGLSSNRVYSIIQDSLGFIWFGTNHGLNRFDGISFKRYHYINGDTNSISSNGVSALMISRENKMWVALDGGIDIYDPLTDSFSHFTCKTTNGEQITGRVTDIVEDSSGQIWIATMYRGLYRYTPDNDRLIAYKHIDSDPYSISQNRVMSILEDSQGVIWVATYSEGLCSFSKDTERFTQYKHSSDKNSLSDNSVQKIYEDSFNNLWIGTFQNGLDRFDRETGRFTNFPNSKSHNLLHRIHDIMEYRPGELLISSDNGAGVFNVTEGEVTFNNDHSQQIFSNTNKFVYSIFKDREDGFWLGSYFNGIEYIPPTQENFIYYDFGSDEKKGAGRVINTICEGRNNLFWIGTDDNGIHIYDATLDETRAFRSASDVNSTYYCIHDLLIDDGKLFAATYERGLEVYNLKERRTRSYLHDPKDSNSIPSSRVFSLFKSASGRIYVGTANGLCYYSRENDNFVKLKIDFRIQAIVEDSKNNLWVATKENGLYYYNIKTNEYKHYLHDINDSHSLTRNSLSTLTYDSKKRLWIGTDGYGLCRYDENSDSFIQYNELELPNDIISKIIPDGELLWISTNNGLVAWSVETNVIKPYSISNGLYNPHFVLGAGMMGSNGKIFLGSSDGLCVFSPHKLEENRYNPLIVVTNFSINNRSINPQSENSPLKNSIEATKKIELTHKQTMIGIEFASLSYVEPKENLYEYSLDGFDEEWHSTNGRNRMISYTNLPSGEYTFRVRGTNSDNIWSDDQVALQIVVKPHFLRSKTAIILYIICFIVLTLLTIWYLLRQSKKIHNKRIEQLEIEKQKEVYDSKMAFFTNIAHEIRTPLSLIIGPLEYVMKSREINDRYGEYLSVIERNYQRLYTLVRQLIDFRKMDSGNYKIEYCPYPISELIDNVVSLFKMTSIERKITVNSRITPSDLILITDKEILTKVLSNLLSNAMKYARSLVDIRVEQDQTHTQIIIEDDGPGIPEEERESIFELFYQVRSNKLISHKGVGIGLHFTKSLIELLDGEISVAYRTEEGSGAAITIKLPLVDATEILAKRERCIDDFLIDDHYVRPTEEQQDQAEATEIKHSLMIVDDNREILDFLSKILLPYYFVIAVLSGEEALQILETNQVDLIVSDIMMDGIDGLELCRHVKKSIHTSHIPFVLLTAKTDIATKIEGLDIGADAYIEKPFSPFYLKAKLKNLLKKRDELKEKFASSTLPEATITTYNKIDEEFIDKCTVIINENIGSSDFSIETLSSEMAMSRTSIFTKIKAITGMTPNDYIKLIRLKTACNMMNEGRYRVTEIGFLVGFNSSSYFAKCFAKQFEMLPTEYMKNIEEKRARLREDHKTDRDNLGD